MNYSDFVQRKFAAIQPCGFDAENIPASLFPHQSDLVRWAVKRGRAAIFADTGLGKSRMQLAWADAVFRKTGEDVLILAPLAVAQQTVQEGAEIGVLVTHCREASDVRPGINIANYERVHKFDMPFGGVVLDESSIIKHHDAKTFRILTERFARTAYKLCATATPAPNDWTELGTHAEFLGICSRAEMLAEFFTHDGGETSVWRLKGHARHIFWQWVVSWGALIRRPSDLGHDDSAYELPPLHLVEHTVGTSMPTNGALFAMEAQTLSERRDARRFSLEDRVKACVNEIAGENNAIEKRLHESVLPAEQGEVEAQSGGERGAEREAQAALCGARITSGEGESIGEEMAAGKPGKEEIAASKEVRVGSVGCVVDARRTKRAVRDLRLLRLDKQEHLSACGSLPQDGASAGSFVPELQSGVGQVQRRSESPIFGGGISREKWLIWCELNDEQDLLERSLRELGISYVSIRGATDLDRREKMERDWRLGDVQVMVSKPSVFGFGLNWQHCARMAFVGVTDSFEAYYQAVRRCWRFGQSRQVNVHVFASESEGAIVANLKRKEKDAIAMSESLSAETRDAVFASIKSAMKQTNDYKAAARVSVPAFLEAA